jgi:peptide-methionine (R)-S-oxide reductase
MNCTRREMIGAGVGAAGIALLAGFGIVRPATAAESNFPYKLSDAEWRKKLGTGDAYAVLRHEATETPGSSPLLKEHRTGTFTCAGCAQPVFSSKTKFESGTGWPSFWAPLPKAIGTSSDTTIGYTRTEVHCARCGGHLGHVFDDGPKPTGLRYCMNGVAMKFTPGQA